MSGEFPLEQCPHDEWRETYGPPNIKWCEERLCAPVEEPANAWSNLAYLIVALFVAYRYRRQSELTNCHMRILAAVVFAMGAFSFWYHATNNYLSQVFDFVGMFLYVGLLIAWNIRRLKIPLPGSSNGATIGQSLASHAIVYGALLGLNMLLLFTVPLADIPIQAIITWNVLGILLTEALVYITKYRKNPVGDGRYLWFAPALALMLAATTCSILDGQRVWCDPEDHIWQGHAMWHILSALSIYPVARFYNRVFRPGAD